MKKRPMFHWLGKGLASGIKSTRYPGERDETFGVSPGRPDATRMNPGEAGVVADRCPTGALLPSQLGLSINYGTCVHCLRCRREGPEVVGWQSGYEWGTYAGGDQGAAENLPGQFRRSVHVRFVDAGACGACMSEARLLNNPYYNMHRLGIFMTASPRQADILLVAGPLTDAMRVPLREAYEAMPSPKRVVVIGVCAISGGVFGSSFASAGGIAECVPVDVIVPGCPPPPLAILHGLLLAMGRVSPATLTDELREEATT